MAVYEGTGFFGERDGAAPGLLHRFLTPDQTGWSVARFITIKAEKLLKTAPQRCEFLVFAHTQMPLTHQTRGVPSGAKHIRQCLQAEIKPHVLRFGQPVILQAIALLISPRQHRRPRRTAQRGCDIAAGETHAFGRQLIDVWRLDLLRAVTSNITPTNIVTNHK